MKTGLYVNEITMDELNPSCWVGQADETTEIIWKPKYILIYMALLIQNIHNLIEI